MASKDKQKIAQEIEKATKNLLDNVEDISNAAIVAIKDSIEENYDNKQDYFGGSAWTVQPMTEWMHDGGYGEIMVRSGDLQKAAPDALKIKTVSHGDVKYKRIIDVDYNRLPISPRGFNYGAHHDAGDFKFLPTDDEIEMGYTDDFDVLGGMYDPIDELERLTDDFESKVDDIMNELDMFD